MIFQEYCVALIGDHENEIIGTFAKYRLSKIGI